MASSLRAVVSKKKKRYHDKESGFDLDLSYITDRVIAMGFPSTGAEALFRNPLPEVKRFFESRHPGHYKVYNLCAEKAYDLQGVFPNTEHVPFRDHNPCKLEVIPSFCASVDEYLSAHPKNVVAIHCKAGKGRTGLMISAYLVHSGVCPTAADALALFGRERTLDRKGVTIPSQMRYVYYYEQSLLRGIPRATSYQVTHIRFVTVPKFDVSGGCDPYFKVSVSNSRLDNYEIYDYRMRQTGGKKKLRKYKEKDHFVDLDVSTHNLIVRDNVKFAFFDYDRGASDDKMFHLWVHTGFIESGFLCFEKDMLDDACKDKSNSHFDPLFKLEMFLHPVDETEEEFNSRYSAAFVSDDTAVPAAESNHHYYDERRGGGPASGSKLTPQTSSSAAGGLASTTASAGASRGSSSSVRASHSEAGHAARFSGGSHESRHPVTIPTTVSSFSGSGVSSEATAPLPGSSTRSISQRVGVGASRGFQAPVAGAGGHTGAASGSLPVARGSHYP